jgi:hypothetical protein
MVQNSSTSPSAYGVCPRWQWDYLSFCSWDPRLLFPTPRITLDFPAVPLTKFEAVFIVSPSDFQIGV